MSEKKESTGGLTRREFIAVSGGLATLVPMAAEAQAAIASFPLFGYQVEYSSAAVWSNVPPGATLTWADLANRKVTIDFNGAIPAAGTLKFEATFDVRTDANGVSRLFAPNAKADAMRFSLAAGKVITAGSQPDERRIVTNETSFLPVEGVGFQIDRNLIKPTVSSALDRPLSGASNQEVDWPRYYVATLDLKRNRVLLKSTTADASKNQLVLRDTMTGLGGRKENVQSFSVREIETDGNAMNIWLTSTNGVLEVQADVLDSYDISAAGNELSYQFELVNGALKIRRESAAEVSASWAGPNAALLALHLRDENGNPIAVSAPVFPLRKRDGLTLDLKGRAPSTAELEQTIATIVVDAGSGIGASLRTIDVARVAPPHARKEGERYWLSNGDVPIAATAPLEIHGINRGLYLLRRSATPAAKVTTRAIGNPLQPLFMLTGLTLGTSEWEVFSYFDSRDLYPGVGDSPPQDISLRVARPLANPAAAGFTVPMFNASYALANMAGLNRQATVAIEGADWLRSLNAQFSDGSRFSVPVPTGVQPGDPPRLTHTAGFEYDPPAQPFELVVPMPPGTAETSAATLPRGARVRSGVTAYVHGGARTPGTLGDLTKELGSTAAADFQKYFETFRDFWNGRSTIGQPEQELARLVLREYLEPEANDAPPLVFFDTAFTRLDQTIGALTQQIDNRFDQIRAAIPDATVLRTEWLKGAGIPFEIWTAFRRELSWKYASEHLALEFFVDALARARDTVENLSAQVDPGFSQLAGVLGTATDTAAFRELWLNSSALTQAQGILWRRFCQYLKSPGTPSIYRRALQAMFARSASTFSAGDAAMPPSTPLPTGLVLSVGEPVIFSVSVPDKTTLADLADAINETIKVKQPAFEKSVRAFTERLNDGSLAGAGQYHLMIDTTGPYAVAFAGTKYLNTIPLGLRGVFETLKAPVYRFIDQFEKNYFEKPVAGFLNTLREGVDPLYQKLEQVWNDGVGVAGQLVAVRGELRRRYGAALTEDVYRRFTDAEDAAVQQDAKRLVALYNAAANESIKSLNELRPDSPAYLFFTKRFPLKGDRPPAEAEWPWRRNFDLCRFSKDKAWTFFLTNDSSVIVKLTGERSIKDIIEELHELYKGPGRENPLAIPLTTPEGGAPSLDLAGFVDRLHPDITRPEWRGVLVIGPTADISADEQLADLCGFQHIGAEYAAVGGREIRDGVPLDIYAFITKKAPPEGMEKRTDVALSVTKFEASIRNTQLVAGEVVLNVEPKNIWGKDAGQQPAGKEFKTLIIRGTVAKEEKTVGNGGTEPSSFQFAATFEQPQRFEIDLGFIDRFELRSICVGRNRGQTSLNIDGSLVLKDVKLAGWDMGLKDAVLGLKDFRIMLPRAGGGSSTPMGRPRPLDFEFPAVTFDLPSLPSFKLGGILDLKAIGLGLLRRGSNLLPNIFTDRYYWLGNEPDLQNGDFDFSFMRFHVDFGQLPKFGVANIGNLKFELLIGFHSKNGSEAKPGIGIGSLDAKMIDIDFFRVFVLHIDELALKKVRILKEPPAVQDAVCIAMKNAKLRLLDWPVLGKNGGIDGVMLHRGADKATLGMVRNDSAGSAFFSIHWVLLANGIEVDPRILNYLLEQKNAPEGLLDNIIDLNPEPATANVKLLSSASWLLGASFKIGTLIKRGAFILHDQHYYGVALWNDDWLPQLIGADRLTLAYIPGATREQDRFRTSFHLTKLELIAGMRSGEIALEWGVNWDFLIDIGFPWKGSGGYQWERAFSVPVGAYEAKFGFFLEKKTEQSVDGQNLLALAAGVAFYLGYRWEVIGAIAWVRAGIGVFAILQGKIRFLQTSSALSKSIYDLTVIGVIGIYAYGEGGVDVWILSARFFVSVQAALAGTLYYIPGGSSTLSYEATLAAHYSASCRVGSGIFSYEFSVSGDVGISVSGRLALT